MGLSAPWSPCRRTLRQGKPARRGPNLGPRASLLCYSSFPPTSLRRTPSRLSGRQLSSGPGGMTPDMRRTMPPHQAPLNAGRGSRRLAGRLQAHRAARRVEPTLPGNARAGRVPGLWCGAVGRPAALVCPIHVARIAGCSCLFWTEDLGTWGARQLRHAGAKWQSSEVAPGAAIADLQPA